MSRVAVFKCNKYDVDVIEKRIIEGIDILGGVDRYIKSGMNVLLKCNLLSKKHPEEAVTTHPAVVEAVARIVQKAGGIPIIADSPGGFFNEKALKGIYKACGMLDIQKNTGAQLNFDTESVDVSHPEGKIIKSLTVIKPLKDVDVVISLPKLKTHGMMVYTGAVKNLFGVIPGTLKAEYHLRMKRARDFSDMLVDICTYVKPTLTIMDAIVGMEGDGPSAGTPRDIGAILLSEDPFALDVTACSLVGIPLDKVFTIQRAKERGLCASMDDVQTAGDDFASMKIEKFKLPKSSSTNFFERWLPNSRGITNFLNNTFGPRPLFDHDICIGCRECYNHCPPKAITMHENRPYVDLKSCIRCYCCQELCPKKAVSIKQNAVFKIFR